MRYCNENHSFVRDLPTKEISSFYYSCSSLKMNILFNGGVNKRFKGQLKQIEAIVGCAPSARVIVYHAMVALNKECKGFVVPLRSQLFTDLKKAYHKRKLPTYNSFTNGIENLVSSGYGTLYKGDNKDVPNAKYKSVFVITDKFKSLFSDEDYEHFPTDKVRFDDLIRVMSNKNGKGTRKQLTGTFRGADKLRKEVQEIIDYLSQFEFRTGVGDRFYINLFRSFVLSLDNYGRWYFSVQSMSTEERKWITADSECMCEWDIVSNHANMCREVAGSPEDNAFKPYSIDVEGLIPYVPDGGSERDVYKKGVVCLTTCSRRGAANAFKNTWDDDLKGYGGKENSTEILNHLREHNKDYLDVIEKHDAGSLQYLDSCILLHAMKYLMRLQIPFFPLHDALLVPLSSGTVARDAFEYGWEKVLGSNKFCFVERKF